MRPRRVWYVVAALLALLLAGGGAAVLVVTVGKMVDAVDADHSFPGGGSRRVSLTEGETKAVYVSQSGKGRVDCRIPGMRSGSMKQPGSTFKVTAGSRTWERVFEVEPGSTGDYTLTCTSQRQARFALGDEPHAGAAVGGIFAAVALFFAAFASAVVITVVTALRRRGHRRRLAATAAPPQWGRPPYGPTGK